MSAVFLAVIEALLKANDDETNGRVLFDFESLDGWTVPHLVNPDSPKDSGARRSSAGTGYRPRRPPP